MSLAQYSDDMLPPRQIEAQSRLVSGAMNASVDAANVGLAVDKLDKFLYEIRLQPMWRREADLDAEYYDGNQIDHQTLDDMQRLGMAPLIRNLIRPTIDVALGMEAKTRSDWRVQADGEQDQEVAEALSQKLHEAEREARADRAISDAYAGQMKTGIAWVEVSREMDPFRYPYRVCAVSRREIFWDWRAKDPELRDARYLVRRRWQDVDILELMFPDHADLIRGLGWSKANWDTPLTDFPAIQGRTWMYERDVTIPESDWRDSTRKRLCLYEVWYRVWTRGFVVRTPDGRTVEVDLNNARHAQALAAGVIEPIPAIFPKMRLSWWIGPHRIADMATPYRHQNFPYIPFWGYREDLTQIPYGLIRSMRSPQDEINARLSKMMWLLSAKRVITDADQVDDIDELRREVARPDAMIVLSASRRRDPGAKFEVQQDFQLAQQQFQVLQDATKAIQTTAGVYQAMLGDRQGGSNISGVANNTLIEQGSTTLAEINDNFRFGRLGVGEALVELIVEDLGRAPAVVNVDEKFGSKKKTVLLNQPGADGKMNNDVQRAMYKVALEDVPSTPAYRAQQLMMLGEMTKALPPQIQAFVVPFILEASEMPHRREVADQVRKALGMGEGGQDQTFTKEQVMQEVQKAIEQFKQQSGLDLKAREVGAKEASVKIQEKDAETRRLIADATVAEKVVSTDMTILDTLLSHDKAMDQGGNRSAAAPNRGAKISQELAA
jgi:hypothetical protein